MSSCVEVVRPGLFTTVQDAGRWGWQAQGVSVAGPMDPFALRMANAWVGNDRSAAALEITLAGPELRFEDRRVVAIAGAVFLVSVDGQTVSGRHAFAVAPGAHLRFGQRMKGARAYLAVSGGFDVVSVLGSRSTHVPSRMGGWCGRQIAAGDRLPLGNKPRDSKPHGQQPLSDLHTEVVHPIRVLPGPDHELFGSDALDVLQAAPYQIAPDSNRIGYRLRGMPIPSVRASGYVSDVVPIGTLQVPSSGQPILLMADRQSTGGYPRLATVISADIGAAGQAAPGDELRFEVCTLPAAREALTELERQLMAAESM